MAAYHAGLVRNFAAFCGLPGLSVLLAWSSLGQSVRGVWDRGGGGDAILKIVRIIGTVVGVVLGAVHLVLYLGRLRVSLRRVRKPIAARIAMYQ